MSDFRYRFQDLRQVERDCECEQAQIQDTEQAPIQMDAVLRLVSDAVLCFRLERLNGTAHVENAVHIDDPHTETVS